MCQNESSVEEKHPLSKSNGSLQKIMKINNSHHIPIVSSFFGLIVAYSVIIRTAKIPCSVTGATFNPNTTPAAKVGLKRGKLMGDSFDAKDLYQAYTEIQSEYYQRAFFADEKSWKILNDKDGVQVAMMQHAEEPNCPYVRLTAILPTPMEKCWEFLKLSNWGTTMPKMDPFYEGVDLYGEYTYKKKVHMILARKRTKRILAFAKRDFTFVSVTDQPLKDGTWVSGTVSVQTPRIPRQKGYTRAFQDSIAFYKPTGDYSEATKVTIIFRIDLNDSASTTDMDMDIGMGMGGREEKGQGGWIPMWLYVKTIGATGAKSVINMRNALVEDQQDERLKLELEQGMSEDQPWTDNKKKKKLFSRIWNKKTRVKK